MEKIALKKPYTFEGKEYTEIDLSGMEKLKVKDMIEVQKAVGAEPSAAILSGASTAFVMELAARATGLPKEFFKLLPARAAMEVRTAIMKGMAGEKQEEEKKIVLEKEAVYEGKKNSEITFPGAGDICAMDMTNAENKIAEEGFAAPVPTMNYLYCCLMAARASGLPVEFFESLPICEAGKIRNMVQRDSFFE